MKKIILVVLIIINLANSFSVPGLSLKTFTNNKRIDVLANELDSVITQLPFDYNYLNWCQVDKIKTKHELENIGSVLLGDTTQSTPYSLNMNYPVDCLELCVQQYHESEINNFKWMIDHDYRVNLMIDNLPSIYRNGEDFEVGYPIGYYNELEGDDGYYIYNHLRFEIYYHENENVQNQYNIVEFFISPFSSQTKQLKINDEQNQEILEYEPNCKQEKQSNSYLPQSLTKEPIAFSYEVAFFKVDKPIGSRWDHYKQLGNDDIHWISIINSTVINVILSAIVFHIIRRATRKDIEKYTQVTSQDIQEDQGWKQIQRDVFRSPTRLLFLCVFVGVGIQIIFMIVLALLFTVIGFINDTYRGSVVSAMIMLYVFLSGFSGYYSARMYKMYNGPYWLRLTIMTATFFPLINMIIFFVINFLMTLEESSGAIHFKTLLELFVMWFGITIPLTFLGSFLGFKRTKHQNPCQVDPVPTYIPDKPWFLTTKFCCLLGGLLPFGFSSIFIEMVFIMMSIWRHSFYYLFAFLFVVFLILIITCAEISIVITYLQLCHGNHKWQWKSFLTSGFCAVDIFIYSILYWWTQLEIVRFSSTIIYFGVMLMISFVFFLFCGTIGYIGSFAFVHTIYSQIKAH